MASRHCDNNKPSQIVNYEESFQLCCLHLLIRTTILLLYKGGGNFKGRVTETSKLLSRSFMTQVESQIGRWVTKPCRCTFLLEQWNQEDSHTVVGEAAFSKAFFQKTSPRMDAIFSYRLSRAHNTAEEVFGILSARCQASQMKPEKADSQAMAACIFCNCLKATNIG